MLKHKKGLEPPIREKVSLVKIVFGLFSKDSFPAAKQLFSKTTQSAFQTLFTPFLKKEV